MLLSFTPIFHDVTRTYLSYAPTKYMLIHEHLSISLDLSVALYIRLDITRQVITRTTGPTSGR